MTRERSDFRWAFLCSYSDFSWRWYSLSSFLYSGSCLIRVSEVSYWLASVEEFSASICYLAFYSKRSLILFRLSSTSRSCSLFLISSNSRFI